MTLRRWRLGAGVFALIALGLVTYGLLKPASTKQIDTKLQAGKPAPAPGFELEVLALGRLPSVVADLESALSDGQLGLEELRGTPIALNFWASWCYPCRQEAPILESGWRRDGRNGVLYLGLNMQDSTGEARQFLSKYGIDYPTIRDPGKDIAQSYGAIGIPETYFIDARGQVVGHVVGVISAADLAAGVAAARRGRVSGLARGGQQRPQR